MESAWEKICRFMAGIMAQQTSANPPDSSPIGWLLERHYRRMDLPDGGDLRTASAMFEIFKRQSQHADWKRSQQVSAMGRIHLEAVRCQSILDRLPVIAVLAIHRSLDNHAWRIPIRNGCNLQVNIAVSRVLAGVDEKCLRDLHQLQLTSEARLVRWKYRVRRPGQHLLHSNLVWVAAWYRDVLGRMPVIAKIRQCRQTTADVLNVIKCVAGHGHEQCQQHGLNPHPGFSARLHGRLDAITVTANAPDSTDRKSVV